MTPTTTPPRRVRSRPLTGEGSRKCRHCPAAAAPGFALCAACREKNRLDGKARYAARKAAGLCVQSGCSAAVTPGRPYCYTHHEHRVRAKRVAHEWRPPATAAPRHRPLTPEQWQLVVEFEPRVRAVVFSLPVDVRRYYGGDDAVASDVRLAVSEAARVHDAARGIPFRAFAYWMLAQQWRREYIAHANAKAAVWRTPVDHEKSPAELLDYRTAPDNPALSAWHDPDYAEQRQNLDWQTRVYLYLRAVEGMSTAEAGEAMGMGVGEARELEYLATRNLAYLRNPTPYDERPTTYTALKKVHYRRGAGTYTAVSPDRPRKCDLCPGLATPGRVCCDACRVKRRARVNAQRAARVAAGLCRRGGCKASPLPGLQCCHEHHEERRAERARRGDRLDAATGSPQPAAV